MQLDYIAFGAHGPREPLTKPGHAMKVWGGVAGVLAASGALFYAIRLGGKFIFFYFRGGVVIYFFTAIFFLSFKSGGIISIEEIFYLIFFYFKCRSRNSSYCQQGMGGEDQRVPQEPKLQPCLWYLLRRIQGNWLCRQQINNILILFTTTHKRKLYITF